MNHQPPPFDPVPEVKAFEKAEARPRCTPEDLRPGDRVRQFVGVGRFDYFTVLYVDKSGGLDVVGDTGKHYGLSCRMVERCEQDEGRVEPPRPRSWMDLISNGVAWGAVVLVAVCVLAVGVWLLRGVS